MVEMAKKNIFSIWFGVVHRYIKCRVKTKGFCQLSATPNVTQPNLTTVLSTVERRSSASAYEAMSIYKVF